MRCRWKDDGGSNQEVRRGMRDDRGNVEGSKGALRHRPRVGDPVEILGLGPGWWWQTNRGIKLSQKQGVVMIIERKQGN